MEDRTLEYYIERHLQGRITPQETAVLLRLLEDPREEERLNEIMTAQLDQWDQSGLLFEDVSKRIQERLLTEIAAEADQAKQRTSVRVLRRKYWLAASVIALLGLGFYFYRVVIDKPLLTAIHTPKDIQAPAVNRAAITLSDGRQIFLDSADNGQLAQQGNTALIKLANGQIAYQGTDKAVLKQMQYNTLTNPRGSKVIDMQLADGSHVWLNAGSSITYPVAFVGNERKVELKGEGYFEIAKLRLPFIVVANGTTTEVLGTHFNVNAYEEEPETKVTLLEGHVRVMHNTQSIVLKPGQQGVANASALSLRPSADLAQVMAWKNGYFYLDNAPFEEVMRQLSAWYDITVSYPSGVPKVELFGKMGRDLSLIEVLQNFKEAGIQWKLDGRKLIIQK
ncbi:MAG: FecR domain-containing protein [Niabella sp.]|nr:FecR domain-containing protein [Niabella sp.]